MGVIQFPAWKVWVYAEEDARESFLRRWINEESISRQILAQFQLYVDLLEGNGPEMVRATNGISLLDKKEDLHMFNLKVKGQPPVNPIFCYGPYGDREITILAGAPVTIQGGILQAKHMIPIASENRKALLQFRGRRRRERIA